MEDLPLIEPCSHCGSEESEVWEKEKGFCFDCWEEKCEIEQSDLDWTFLSDF